MFLTDPTIRCWIKLESREACWFSLLRWSVIFNRIFLEREVFLKKLAGIKKLDYRVFFRHSSITREKKRVNHHAKHAFNYFELKVVFRQILRSDYPKNIKKSIRFAKSTLAALIEQRSMNTMHDGGEHNLVRAKSDCGHALKLAGLAFLEAKPRTIPDRWNRFGWGFKISR